MKKFTEEHKKKIGQSLKGVPKSESHRKKLSDLAKERLKNPEERLKISLATKEGMTDPEIRKIMSDKKKDFKPWNTGLSTEEISSHYVETKPGAKLGSTPHNKGTAKFQKEYDEALLNPPLCACGCGEKITILEEHKWRKLPIFIHGHSNRVNNPFQGKKHTEESKQKMSKSHQNATPYYSDTKPELIVQEALSNIGIDFTTQKKVYGIPDIFIEPNICIFVDGCFFHACPLCYPDMTEVIIGSTLVKDRQFKDQKVTEVLTAQGYKVLRFWEHDIYGSIESCLSLIF